MRSRRGARWAILTLQDRTGVCDALVFPEAFQKLEAILKAATPLLVKGRVAVEDVGTRVIVSDARLLDQVRDQGGNGAAQASGTPSLLRVRVSRSAMDATIINQLHELFASCPGRCRVAFDLVQDDGTEATIDAESAVSADRYLVERVREICGSDSVAVVQ
jgi:DNA polymerase-3 subunit alpha